MKNKEKVQIYRKALRDIGNWSQKIQDEAEKQGAGIAMYRGCVAVANLALTEGGDSELIPDFELTKTSDMVYLLSITYSSSGDPSGSLYVDENMKQPTTSMGEAMAFDTENGANEFRTSQVLGLSYQVTPIKATRYFEAKLAGK